MCKSETFLTNNIEIIKNIMPFHFLSFSIFREKLKDTETAGLAIILKTSGKFTT